MLLAYEGKSGIGGVSGISGDEKMKGSVNLHKNKRVNNEKTEVCDQQEAVESSNLNFFEK